MEFFSIYSLPFSEFILKLLIVHERIILSILLQLAHPSTLREQYLSLHDIWIFFYMTHTKYHFKYISPSLGSCDRHP
jgi:hypothetical protein